MRNIVIFLMYSSCFFPLVSSMMNVFFLVFLVTTPRMAKVNQKVKSWTDANLSSAVLKINTKEMSVREASTKFRFHDEHYAIT